MNEVGELLVGSVGVIGAAITFTEILKNSLFSRFNLNASWLQLIAVVLSALFAALASLVYDSGAVLENTVQAIFLGVTAVKTYEWAFEKKNQSTTTDTYMDSSNTFTSTSTDGKISFED